jgi:hypothetical protein
MLRKGLYLLISVADFFRPSLNRRIGRHGQFQLHFPTYSSLQPTYATFVDLAMDTFLLRNMHSGTHSGLCGTSF